MSILRSAYAVWIAGPIALGVDRWTEDMVAHTIGLLRPILRQLQVLPER